MFQNYTHRLTIKSTFEQAIAKSKTLSTNTESS